MSIPLDSAFPNQITVLSGYSRQFHPAQLNDTNNNKEKTVIPGSHLDSRPLPYSHLSFPPESQTFTTTSPADLETFHDRSPFATANKTQNVIIPRHLQDTPMVEFPKPQQMAFPVTNKPTPPRDVPLLPPHTSPHTPPRNYNVAPQFDEGPSRSATSLSHLLNNSPTMTCGSADLLTINLLGLFTLVSGAINTKNSQGPGGTVSSVNILRVMQSLFTAYRDVLVASLSIQKGFRSTSAQRVVEEAFEKLEVELEGVINAPPDKNAKLFDAASYPVTFEGPNGERMLVDLFSIVRSNMVHAKKKDYNGRKRAKI
jgi:hypothetical protein